ncbi:carboxymuconolactone decarboxylase family protein [Candidatus Thioglobus sp.]|uniref:carboxymuconolactone decarboxylase family protein n=1 Tax=Candidatus Thioglobus sp. TaxID=2026721 RepID=UPI003D0B832D
MSLLKTVKVDEAEGKVKEIYDEITQSFGSVPNALQLWSINPQALEDQWNSIKIIMAMDIDSQKLHTILRFLIAENNDCEYCTGFNKGMLLNVYGFSVEEIENIKKDPATASLEEKNKALLVFTLKAINDTHSVGKDDISKLEELGCSQKNIFDTVQSASHMKVVTILFDTFKVEIDF